MIIPRRFAIANREVTVEQFQRFVKTNPQFRVSYSGYLNLFSPDPDGPMIIVTWYGAAAYCNWLSDQEGLPKDQWCYIPNESGGYAEGMTIPANVLERTGYRLPTDAEWEYACRAGTVTSRYYGLSVDLLDKYARYPANSRDHAWSGGSLLPNDLGLFDMLGNVYEWCQDKESDGVDGVFRKGKKGLCEDYIYISESIKERYRRWRGGSFNYRTSSIRSADTNRNFPSNNSTFIGFRLSRTYP
jgi:formylglycine-generating enzyme required for sulfatase activity